MDLSAAAVHGLRARVCSLRDDLDHWAERADTDLPKHKTQIMRLCEAISGVLATAVVGKPLDPDVGLPHHGLLLKDVPRFRRGLGSVHLMWDFYRDKLAQRDVGSVSVHLAAADDLAWACYEPFLAAVVDAAPQALAPEDVKEPPLVFYHSDPDRAPFAQARTKILHPDGFDEKDLEQFAAQLQRLPVPVIGVPWEVANRMPELALVGHEAGHVIAEDLGFAAEAKEAVRGAGLPETRTGVWLKWTDEIFADVVGVHATGSAFVDRLAIELAGDRDAIRLAPIDVARPGRYPTPTLRVALCGKILELLDVSPPPAWSNAYGNIVGSSAEYADDIDVVAVALTSRPWEVIGGKSLAACLPWDAAREAQAVEVGADELGERVVGASFDPHIWVAAATHAYVADPSLYVERGLDKVLANKFVQARTEGPRSSGRQRRQVRDARRTRSRDTAPAESADDRDRALRAADRRLGADIARELGLV